MLISYKFNISGISSPAKQCSSTTSCNMLWTNLTQEVLYQVFFCYSPCVCVYPANASLSVPVDTKAVFDCPSILLTSLVVTTWQIILRDKLSCTRAYRRDRNETKEGNCTDERITWASRPDENLALQIDPVATTHDGFYMCQMVTPDGNFHRGYHLQVLGKEEHILWYFR